MKMKFPINTRVLVDSTNTHDYYIMHCDREWYIEAHPSGEINHEKKTMAGFNSLKQAKQCIECWKTWIK